MKEERWQVDERIQRSRDLRARIEQSSSGYEWMRRIDRIGKGKRSVRPLHNGDRGEDVKRLQRSIGTRARARDAPHSIPHVDGQMGPQTRADMHYVAYLLGLDNERLHGLLKGAIHPADQMFVMNPVHRSNEELARASRRLAAHKKVRARQRREAAASTAKRRRIVAEAEHAAANYRKDPGAYHYLAGGKANLVYLHPTPRDWRSDCSQFAAAVYHAAGLPSPASVPHEWASTFTMVKAPGVRFVDKAHRKPGMLGMYGSRSAPHHVEIWCGDRFIGHGSPPIDSLTPGEPDYYLDFPFLN